MWLVFVSDMPLGDSCEPVHEGEHDAGHQESKMQHHEPNELALIETHRFKDAHEGAQQRNRGDRHDGADQLHL